MTRRFLFLLAMVLLCPVTGSGQTRWSFTLNGGVPGNIPMPMKISQTGYPGISLFAKFSSEPFRTPFYWMWRFARVQNKKGWEFEAIHHKLILENRPAEIQEFRITHGFNMLFINRSHHNKTFNWRYGAGVILAHPENEVNNLHLDEKGGILNRGYYISGPLINLSIGREFYLTKRIFANVEAKATSGIAFVPVYSGRAEVGHLSLHLIAGFGYDFLKKR